jgi:Protein of unknown function (DUF6044)
MNESLLKRIGAGKWLMPVVIVLLCLQFVPFLTQGEDSWVTVDDNLDGDFALISELAKTGQLLDLSGEIDFFMNGVPRSTFSKGWSAPIIFFAVFPPFWAYVLAHIFVHCIAFAGMFLLLRRYLSDRDEMKPVVMMVALLFGYVSYYPLYGLTVAGLPLLLYVAMNVLNERDNRWDWALLCVFPFCSVMVLTAPFALSLLAVVGIWNKIRLGKLPRKYVAAIFLLTTMFIFSELPMLYESLIEKSFVSQRTEWVRDAPPGFKVMLTDALQKLDFTHYHAGFFQTRPIQLVVLIAIVVALVGKRLPRQIVGLSFMLGGIALFHAFYPLLISKLSSIGLLSTFQFDRFYLLAPFLWLLILAFSFREISKTKVISFTIIPFFLWSGYSIVTGNKELVNNLKQLGGTAVSNNFRAFYREDQFVKVKEIVNRKEGSKVVSLGMSPAIALYNGLSCLDGYYNNYSLDYKHQFRRIMAAELERSETCRNYFDNWGSRCYIFPAELNLRLDCANRDSCAVKELRLDYKAFKELGGTHLISAFAIPIDSMAEIHPVLVHHEKGEISDLYLYEVK